MKIIYTKNKDEILVDDDVYDWASKYTWYIHNTGYAKHTCSNEEKNVTGKKFVFLHCLIMTCPKGMVRDHINGNKLDNQRHNLRICSRTQNVWNQKVSINNKSGYKGVSWKAQSGKWQVRIGFMGRLIHLGYFDDKKVAARAYDEAAMYYFGSFAKTNFQEKTWTPEKQ